MTATAACSERPLEVLMLPDYRGDNPYQSLLANAIARHGARVQFPQGYRRGLPIFRASRGDEQPFDLVHLHWLAPYARGRDLQTKSVYSLQFLLDSLLTRWSGVRLVFTIHNAIGHDAAFADIDVWVRRSLVRWVDRIIVHHQTALDLVAEQYRFDPAKATVIPHGHYRQVYGAAIAAASARKQLGLPLEGKLYLNLGMVRPYKGITPLLDAWQASQLPAAGHTLLIAGKALDADYGAAIAAKTEATPNALWHSHFIADEEMPLYFSAADAVVLPFRSILTSGSLILAMSYDKPAIAPRLGSIAETLGEADDLLYDTNRETGLLDALDRSATADLDGLSQRVRRA
ncbi:MAG: glycosyltransferase, partial [Cyanobacteria bacterium J06648_11]